jgi:hypothetical protein
MKYLLISLLITLLVLSLILLFNRKMEGYYGPLHNIDYPNHDLAYYGNMSAEGCMGLCDSYPDCIGLSHGSRNCWIKNTNAFSSSNRRDLGGINTYFK